VVQALLEQKTTAIGRRSNLKRRIKHNQAFGFKNKKITDSNQENQVNQILQRPIAFRVVFAFPL